MKQDADQERIGREASTWLIRLDDDPDDRGLRENFAYWLATGPEHRAAWSETRALAALLARAAERPLAAPPAHLAGSRRRRWARAAVLAAIAVGGVWMVGPDLHVRIAAQHIAATGEVRLVALADGSRVWLAPGAAIAFAATCGERRLELLRGTAFFDVAHDRAHPFRVDSGGVRVRVLGTAFQVASGPRTEVAVARGLVEVGNRRGEVLARLHPGETIAVDPARPPRDRSAPIASRRGARAP